MARQSTGPTPVRDPTRVQAWLIGSGITSLAAAVHLLVESKMPASNIHILEDNSEASAKMEPFGDATAGYFLPFECHPHFHGSCMERLLTLVPSETAPDQSLMDTVRKFDEEEQPPPHDFAVTRALKRGPSGPEIVYTKGIHSGLTHRMELIKLMLTSEKSLECKRIEDVMDAGFFKTQFWSLWSTTFALQPWHSVIEFQRHLRKYLEDIRELNNVKNQNRAEYNLHESVIAPITKFLEREGVDLRSNAKVTDLLMYPNSDPTTVSEIKLLEEGSERLITVDPQDIVIVTLGSTTSGVVFGANDTPPPSLSPNWDDLVLSASSWQLWKSLAHQSPKFGDPAKFLSRSVESAIQTFTTTFHDPQFLQLYEKLTFDRPGTGALLSLTESNWCITLSVPHQPVFSDQPTDVSVMYGFALRPASQGNYVQKSMYECSGEEIFTEVLSHLDFPVQSILAKASTIPCGMPLGTAPFLVRGDSDRPRVIPHDTTNIACVGQFAEMAEDTTMIMEYSVRSAQTAVCELMGLKEKPPKINISLLLEVFDFMTEL